MLFSIVTPTYNRQAVIAKSIDSSLRFLQESDCDGEIIIVDDASSDNTVSFLKSAYKNHLDNNTIRLIQSATNRGVTGAKQMGAEAAQGEWIIFMDSDDQFTANTGSDLRNTLLTASARTPLFFFRCISISSKKLIGPEQQHPVELNVKAMIKPGTPGECLSVVRRNAILAEPYSEDLKGFEGLTWARIVNRFGNAIVSPIIARTYYDLEESDRLSARKNIRKNRSCLLAKGYYLLIREFWANIGIGTFIFLVKIAYHTMNCLIYGRRS